MFISKSYVEKVWTNHERQAALSRMVKEKDKEYILPVRFDDSLVPGLPYTISHLTASDYHAAELAILIAEKIGIKPS